MKYEKREKILTELLAELQKRAAKWKLWGANFLDRLIFDYELARKMKVVSVGDPTKEIWMRKLKRLKGVRNPNQTEDLPFKPLPNCGQYRGTPSAYDWISGLFGYPLRSRDQEGYIISWRNGHRNRFLIYIFRLLGIYRDRKNKTPYWRTAQNLLRNDVYLIACMNHVIPGWEKTLGVEKVAEILEQVKKMVKERPRKMDYKRVYIEKANGKMRPLGVPTLPWRVYLHMLNNLISWQMKYAEDQHGFRPGRGTGTAWSSLIKKIHEEENIREFDLQSFFDRVKLWYNKQELKRQGVPEELANYIYKLNQSIVKLTKKDMIPEGDHREVIWNSDGSANPNLPFKIRKKLEEGSAEDKQEEIEKLKKQKYTEYKEVGVPQGASTSCSLSILNLRELYEKLRKLIMYADDGIDFPKGVKESISIPAAGVEEALEKGSIVKENGVWKSSLKFLGMEYIPPDIYVEDLEGSPSPYGRLRAHTRGNPAKGRNGSKLEYGVREQFWTWLVEEYEIQKKEACTFYLEGKQNGITETVGEWIISKYKEFEKKTPDEIICEMLSGWGETKLTGTIQSRMYNGSWTEEPTEESSETIHHESWCRRHYGSYIYDLCRSGDLERIIRKIMKDMEEERKRDEIYYKMQEQEETLTCSNWEDIEWRTRLYESLDEEIGETGKEVPKNLSTNWTQVHELVKLTSQNSSTYATDDLICWLRSGGTPTSWAENRCERTLYNSTSDLYRIRTQMTWKGRTKEQITRKTKRTLKQIGNEMKTYNEKWIEMEEKEKTFHGHHLETWRMIKESNEAEFQRYLEFN